MSNRESVITHLQIIHTWAEFARERDLQFFTAKHLEDIAQWSDDAIALLKEQEEQIKTLHIAQNVIADYLIQPEIVRCKDCVNKECFGRDGKIVCDLDGFLHEPDWFCADGGKRL